MMKLHMKHLNPECPLVEIGTGNCPKCNPDRSKRLSNCCNVPLKRFYRSYNGKNGNMTYKCGACGMEDRMKDLICSKCGIEYQSYRDGYCQDCEVEEERKSL